MRTFSSVSFGRACYLFFFLLVSFVSHFLYDNVPSSDDNFAEKNPVLLYYTPNSFAHIHFMLFMNVVFPMRWIIDGILERLIAKNLHCFCVCIIFEYTAMQM